MNNELTPTQVLALKIEGLQAELQIANERIYWLVAELAAAQVKLGNLHYKTMNM